MRCFNSVNVWVYLNWSRHATCHRRSYQIALKQGNQNPQNNMIASFSFASTSRDFDSTIKFNASTGKECCEWFACGTEVAFNIKQVGCTPSSLFSQDQQAAVGSLLQIEAFLPNTSLLINALTKKNDLHEVGLDRYLGTSLRESAKIAHIIEQPNT